MATILATVSGNWSAGGTWVGGTPPGAGDIAVSNNKTVTIDQNVTCSEIRNDTTGGATAGGGFTIGNGVTYTGNVGGAGYNSTYTAVLTCSLNSPNSATIVGNLTGGSVTAGMYAVKMTGSGTLNISGNIIGGAQMYSAGFNMTGTGTVNITGNILGGAAGGSAHGIMASSGTVTVTGTHTGTPNGNGANLDTTSIYNAYGAVSGSQSGADSGYGMYANTSGTVTIQGPVSGGQIAYAPGMYIYGGGPVNITGNVIATSLFQSYGLNASGTGNLTITGNILGGTGDQAYGIRASGNCLITINGDVTPGKNSVPGILMETNGTRLVVNGNVYATVGDGIYFNRYDNAITVNGCINGGTWGPGSATSMMFYAINNSSGTSSPVVKVKKIKVGSYGFFPTNSAFQLIPDSINAVDFYNSLGGRTNIAAAQYPNVSDVRNGVTFGGTLTGSCAVPSVVDVRTGINVGSTVGSCSVPVASEVKLNVPVSQTVGTYDPIPHSYQLISGFPFTRPSR